MKLTPLKIIALIAVVVVVTVAITLTVVYFVNQGNDNENESESATEGEVTEDFDYLNSDLSQYISLSADEYQSNTVTLPTKYLVDDKMVQDYIDDECFKNRKKQNGGDLIYDQPIRYADSAFIYYTGYLDGEKFEGGSNADDKYSYELVIGSGTFIPGFEEGLIGVIPNQTSKENPYSLNVTFPEDYDNIDLAGKSVVFEVWVEYTIQYAIPEFNDDYVAKVLIYNGTAEQYRAEVKENLINASKDEADSAAVAAIVNKLTEKATIHDYPKQSVDYWYSQYVAQYEYYYQYYTAYGYSFESFDKFVVAYLGLNETDDWKTLTMAYAKEMVKSSLIYYTVAKQQGISVSDEEYTKGVKALADYYTDYYTNYYTQYYGYEYEYVYTEEDVIKEVGEAQIRKNILFEKVEDYLLEHCTIEYKDEE